MQSQIENAHQLGEKRKSPEPLYHNEENEHSPAIFITSIKRKGNDICLLTSGWFSLRLFEYLNLLEIGNLDTSICTHDNRKSWLDSLCNYKLNLKLRSNLQPMELIMNWIVLKHIQVEFLHLNIQSGSRDMVISNECLFYFLKNNRNITKFELIDYDPETSMGDYCFEYIATFCQKLQVLDINTHTIPTNALNLLSQACHQLESINLWIDVYDCPCEFALLVVNNRHLKNIKITTDESPYGILSCLGEYCPLVESVDLKMNGDEMTTLGMEIFSKGCRNLKFLSINDLATQFECNQLFKCLGANSANLEELSILCSFYDREDDEDDDEFLTISLHNLTKGCLLLRHIFFYGLNLSIENYSSLAQNCFKLESLKISLCKMTDDGLAEIAKIQNLKKIVLDDISDITYQGFKNMITNCRILEYIRICCVGLIDYMDECLLLIADNCPNLTQICITEIYTIEALWQLYNKCEKLVNIQLLDRKIPIELQEALEKRKITLITPMNEYGMIKFDAQACLDHERCMPSYF